MIFVTFVLAKPVSRVESHHLNKQLKAQGLDVFLNHEGTMLMVPVDEGNACVITDDMKAYGLQRAEQTTILVNTMSASIISVRKLWFAENMTMGKQYKLSLGVQP